MRAQLTEKVIFQEVRSRENENGFDEKSWINYHEVWAKKRDMSGREFTTKRSQQTEIITSFTVRYGLKIRNIIESYQTQPYRIKHKGNFYDIIYPYDVDNKHKTVEFKCRLINHGI